MPHSIPSNQMGPLYVEHLSLGAEFDENGQVKRYGSESPSSEADSGSEAFLCDVSHIQTLLFAGEDATSFATAAFAGKRLEVGECAFQAVLTGDGNVASIPLLARTGTHEYVSFDISARTEVLGAWLSFLASISQEGYEPYARMSSEDATSKHAVLALWGPGARSVLADYAQENSLPHPGEVKSVRLDSHPCILARPKMSDANLYLLLVTPALARVFWRSFLSFINVTPLGMQAMDHMLRARLPWLSALQTTDTVSIYAEDLQDMGLVRKQHDFVGARGLRSHIDAEGEKLV